MTQINDEKKNKFKFMCDEIEGYLFDIERTMDVYLGLVGRESPASVPSVKEQFDAVVKDIMTKLDLGREQGAQEGLPVLQSAVVLCVDALKRVEVAVNQFSQTEIRVDAK